MYSSETSSAPTMIDDIVKHAGVSRGTFYTHFDTVEQIVAEAGSMLADEMVGDARLVFEGLESAMARTATGILLFLTRALFDEHWGGFIVRAGLLREENQTEEHTSELQSLMRISYDVFWLKNTNLTI